jgi:thioesterase domain-containing protein
MITKENEMNDTQTMSDLDIIRQTAAENEGMAPDTTWAEIFSHLYEVELNADHVSPLTRMTIWDALCFLESER